MTDQSRDAGFAGGCLCGALRYRVSGAPLYMGNCYCGDCRKASGSGFIPFIGVAAQAVAFSGPHRPFVSRAANGGPSTRNSCARCASLVFGGVVGESVQFTLYAGSLDDPAVFRPGMAIFGACRPDWVPLPAGLDVVFDAMPPGAPPG